MKKKYLKLNMLVLLVIFVMIGCNSKDSQLEKQVAKALILAGKNRTELEKVLDYYQSAEDELKLKAAKFLIANMPYHSSSEEDNRFKHVFQRTRDIVKDTNNTNVVERVKSLKIIFKKHNIHLNDYNRHYNKRRSNKDVEILSYNFIIRNIELAFEAWQRIPESKRASFDDFCNYILPYRVGNEPVNEYSRLRLYKKYAWVYDEIEKGKSLRSIANKLILGFGFSVQTNIHKYYPSSFSVDQVDLIKLGNCDDGANYFVNVFRALGIVSVKDHVPQWGVSHESKGHAWIHISYGDEEYATGFEGQDFKEDYKKRSVPRVDRNSFEYKLSSNYDPLNTNVTSTYVNVKDLKIENKFDVEIDIPVLCVFNRVNEWNPLHLGTCSWGTSSFKNIGVNVLYLPASVDNQGNITPLNYPFYLTKDGMVDYFTPDNSFIKSAKLLRKYGMSSRKNDWIEGLNGAEFQVSNDSIFNDYKTIYKIEDLHTTQFQKIEINNNNKYDFIRLKSNNKEISHIASLAFYDNKNNIISGEVFTENFDLSNKDKPVQTAFDKNELTFSGGKDFTVGIKLSEPTKIKSIGFQARNDQNHIVVGDEYELFYWNKKWLSIGKQQAQDTVLYYDVPKNSLLWLKNKKGKEEHVFTIDEKTKKQKWLGFQSNY